MVSHCEVQNKQIIKIRLTVRSYYAVSEVLSAKPDMPRLATEPVGMAVFSVSPLVNMFHLLPKT